MQRCEFAPRPTGRHWRPPPSAEAPEPAPSDPKEAPSQPRRELARFVEATTPSTPPPRASTHHTAPCAELVFGTPWHRTTSDAPARPGHPPHGRLQDRARPIRPEPAVNSSALDTGCSVDELGRAVNDGARPWHAAVPASPHLRTDDLGMPRAEGARPVHATGEPGAAHPHQRRSLSRARGLPDEDPLIDRKGDCRELLLYVEFFFIGETSCRRGGEVA